MLDHYADRVAAKENPPPFPHNFTEMTLPNPSKVALLEFMNLWKGYHLSNGEIKDIFQTIDYKHHNFIKENEYVSFYNEFIADFVQNCDPTSDWLMD